MSSTRTANNIEKSAFEQWIKLKLDGKQERKPSEKSIKFIPMLRTQQSMNLSKLTYSLADD